MAAFAKVSRACRVAESRIAPDQEGPRVGALQFTQRVLHRRGIIGYPGGQATGVVSGSGAGIPRKGACNLALELTLTDLIPGSSGRWWASEYLSLSRDAW